MDDCHSSMIAVPRWHAGLSVRNALLDAQHIVMLELLRIMAAEIHWNDKRAFLDTFGDLLSVVEHHCIEEEHQLEKNGFQWLKHHREQHLTVINRLRQLHEFAVQSGICRADAVKAALRWVNTHIVDMDLTTAAQYLRWRPNHQPGLENT